MVDLFDFRIYGYRICNLVTDTKDVYVTTLMHVFGLCNCERNLFFSLGFLILRLLNINLEALFLFIDSLIVAVKPKPPVQHIRGGVDDEDDEDELVRMG